MDTLSSLLRELGLDPGSMTQGNMQSRSPIDGAVLAQLPAHTVSQAHAAITRARHASLAWRAVPAPRRGDLLRLFAEQLRRHKAQLGRLVTLETGKILAEGEGEVQEMIDICDFSVGLSRQLHGLTIASERPGHRMMETWHPLGVVGVISAFNFPVAVWSWNAALALVCGNAVVWKPSEKTPLTALACQALLGRALQAFGDAPPGLSEVLLGGRELGEALADAHAVALVSATGSTRMGRHLGPRVMQRFGRALLELGGNNAVIATPSADLDIALRGIVFGAIGTAGQRCTSTRRLIVHEDIADTLVARLRQAYASVTVGDPLQPRTLVGPLIDHQAYDSLEAALVAAREQGGRVTGGERLLADRYPEAWYVRPALAEMPGQTDVVRHETFAPILYVMRYRDLGEALAMNNDVPQGLSSAIFTNSLREAEAFLAGSDCGIANVNIGTSGAEIGGAFGGEKETGGGRESGSDAWKNYMRRATNTINYSSGLPLAQGIRFEV